MGFGSIFMSNIQSSIGSLARAPLWQAKVKSNHGSIKKAHFVAGQPLTTTPPPAKPIAPPPSLA